MSEPENPQVDPCGPLQTVQIDKCEENPDAPGCDGGGPTQEGETNEVVLPPFLVPWRTIDSALSTADREINIFNRNIFADVTRLFSADSIPDLEARKMWYSTDLESIAYKANLLSSPRRDPNAPFDESQRDRYVDYFRTTFRLLWTWYNGQYERFAPENIPDGDYNTSVPNGTLTPAFFGYLAPSIGASIEEYDLIDLLPNTLMIYSTFLVAVLIKVLSLPSPLSLRYKSNESEINGLLSSKSSLELTK